MIEYWKEGETHYEQYKGLRFVGHFQGLDLRLLSALLLVGEQLTSIGWKKSEKHVVTVNVN